MIEALSATSPPQASWTEPEGGLFIWATLPPYIDTSDLLAKALREDVAFVPGQAAYVDGRGRNSMRLNFSGSSEDEIREGIRRIGKRDRRAGRAVRRADRETRQAAYARRRSRGRGRH